MPYLQVSAFLCSVSGSLSCALAAVTNLLGSTSQHQLSTDFLVLMPRHQELEIEFVFTLEGPGLEVLPRCCPSLKALRLRQLLDLTDCFLPALKHLTVCCAGMYGS